MRGKCTVEVTIGPSAESPDLPEVPSFKSGVGQNIARRASPTARHHNVALCASLTASHQNIALCGRLLLVIRI